MSDDVDINDNTVAPVMVVDNLIQTNEITNTEQRQRTLIDRLGDSLENIAASTPQPDPESRPLLVAKPSWMP